MDRRLRSLLPWLEQAVKFGAVGLLNTAIDLSLYFLLTHWIGLGAVLAKGISYSAGVLNSFYWNKTWTFRSKISTRTTLVPFILVNLTGLAINTGAMLLCQQVLKIAEIAATFNGSPKGKRVPVTSFGDACQSLPPKLLKERDVWVKTREPVRVIAVKNALGRRRAAE